MTTESLTQQLKIGELLVRADIVHEHQMPRALQLAKDRSLRIGQVLIMLRYLSSEELEPILEVQRLINDGKIDGDSAIQALKVMRRDGLPLSRAVELVQAEPADKVFKEHLVRQAQEELEQLEGASGKEGELVPVLLRLGDTEFELRHWERCESGYKRALALLEKIEAADNPALILPLAKLVELYVSTQRYLDAEPLCKRLVEINQQNYGAESLGVGREQQRLARVMDAQGRHQEAEQFLLSTIRIFENQLGMESPELKAALRQLSAFWKRRTKQAEVKRIGELLVDAEVLSSDDLAAALKQAKETATPLGQTLVKLGLIGHEVLRAGLQAQLLVQDGVVPLAVATKALGVVKRKGVEFDVALEEIGWSPDPISTAELDSLLETTDELMAAEKVFGANHPCVAAMLIKLGDQYGHADKFSYAESTYKRALVILKQCWGENSIELASGMFNLANLYAKHKRLIEAESLHIQVLEIRKSALGKDHPEVGQSLEQVARMQEALGNQKVAGQLRDSATSIKTKNVERRTGIAGFLKDKTPFSVLDERVIDKISGLFEEVHCQSGTVVVHDQRQPEGLFVVSSGSVELIQEGLPSVFFTAGDCFGDLEYPRTKQHVGAVRVPEGAFLLRMESGLAAELKEKFPELQAQLLRDAEAVRSQATSASQSLVLHGNFSSFEVTAVLRTICSKEGVLRLSNHKKEEVAAISVKNGGIHAAKNRHLEGIHAVYDLLCRNEGLDFAFHPGNVATPADASLKSISLSTMIMEAARRSDDMPALVAAVGWPQAVFTRKSRVLNARNLSEETASVAADIWMLLDSGASNEQLAEGVYSDLYTFLLAMKELLDQNFLKKESI